MFGRLGYNPNCNPEVWRRELRHRFGDAASDIEEAYRSASQILPLITATRMPSASEWRWWPEMDTGGPLPEYMRTAPSDTAQFYGIRTWKRTPGWWREVWDEFPPGFVEDAVDGKVTGRWTPPQVCNRLNELAQRTRRSLERAKTKYAAKPDAEFRATQLDLRVHAHLAQYHAEKTMAAMHLGFFEVTGDSGRLPIAREHMLKAHSAWLRIVSATDGVYHDNLIFGHSKGSPRSRGGHYHSGHWKDRLPEIESDLKHLEALLDKHRPIADKYQPFAAEFLPKDLPRIEHTPIDSIAVGQDLTIRAKVTSPRPIKQVRLHHRALDQTVDWQRIEMKWLNGDQYEVVIAAKEVDRRRDFMYYIEAIDEAAGTHFPSWEERQPYFVVRVTTKGSQ